MLNVNFCTIIATVSIWVEAANLLNFKIRKKFKIQPTIIKDIQLQGTIDMDTLMAHVPAFAMAVLPMYCTNLRESTRSRGLRPGVGNLYRSAILKFVL